jgi:DNA-directed RNA polymerase beta' subunit
VTQANDKARLAQAQDEGRSVCSLLSQNKNKNKNKNKKRKKNPRISLLTLA